MQNYTNHSRTRVLTLVNPPMKVGFTIVPMGFNRKFETFFTFHFVYNRLNIYLMKQIVIGVVVFFVWLVVSTYWYVCGIKNLCEAPKPKVVTAVVVQEKKAPEEPKPEPVTIVKPEEKLPTIYFISEMDSIKNVDDLISASKFAANYLEKNAETKLYITGNASKDETADDYELGLKRANTVKREMMARGISEDKIITVSKGSNDPKVSGDTPEGKMFNRRVEMVIK